MVSNFDPDKLEELASLLVLKMMEVHKHPSFHGMHVLASMHGMPYNGPTYETEFKALKEYLGLEEEKDND